MMEVWRQTALHYLNEIEKNMEILNDCEADEPTLRAFPMNTQSCTKYGLCPYHNFCTSWENPLSTCNEIPIGFKEERWDPTKTEVKKEKKKEETKPKKIGFVNKAN